MTATKPKPDECCMCGDCGFSEELFQCKVCQFRSQHRYCSNLYPNVDANGTCNWCLVQKDEFKEKPLNSSNSSSSLKNNGSVGDESKSKRIKNGNVNSQKIGGKKGDEVHAKNRGIQKRRSPEARSPPPSVLVSTRKRIVTNGGLEERPRRTRSEDISNTSSRMITRQAFRNKVRRYKLLDEVSS